MALGKEKLDSLAQAAFDNVEEESPEFAVVGCAVLITEVRTGEGETAIFIHSSDRRKWIQRALLQEASQALMFGESNYVETEGDDA